MKETVIATVLTFIKYSLRVKIVRIDKQNKNMSKEI